MAIIKGCMWSSLSSFSIISPFSPFPLLFFFFPHLCVASFPTRAALYSLQSILMALAYICAYVPLMVSSSDLFYICFFSAHVPVGLCLAAVFGSLLVLQSFRKKERKKRKMTLSICLKFTFWSSLLSYFFP